MHAESSKRLFSKQATLGITAFSTRSCTSMKQGEFPCKDALFVKRKYVIVDQNSETGSVTPSKVKPKTVRSGHLALIASSR
jgi:hypothetical protein